MILLRHVQDTPDCSADQALTAAVANNSTAAPGRRKDQINSFFTGKQRDTVSTTMPGHHMPAGHAGASYA